VRARLAAADRAATLDYGLRDRVALVTGAASGIGLATVTLLAEMGVRVVSSDIDAARGAGHAARLTREGHAVSFVRADVANEDDVTALVKHVSDAHGRLDGAANCAGVGGGHGLTADYPQDRWDRIVEVNLRGTFLLLRHQLAAMASLGHGGAIVNVASTLGLRGGANASAYSASKHAVLGVTRTAAIEYAPQGIRVNAVCPGAIDTPMMDEAFERHPGFREALTGFVPLRRMGRPDEVAAPIAWLLSDAASFVTGEALAIEGGLLAR
jgi:NAD(P)-dependent dehydrogenase (short-subunit alcohol dehydrogenase family)